MENTIYKSEALKGKSKNQIIAEILTLNYLYKTSSDQRDLEITNVRERILKILENNPSQIIEDTQVETILSEIHEQGLLERVGLSIQKEKESIDSHVRRSFEKRFAENTNSEETISERIADLRSMMMDASDPKTSERVRKDFPSGNFLFHGTHVDGVIEIISSGEISNFKKLHTVETRKAEVEGRKAQTPKRNSGYEGISWSFNQVDALPGTRYHLAGFLTSPEQATAKGDQLSIPSRPAPFELIQLGGELDSNLYFELKTQQEVIGPVIYDSNIISNLIYFDMGLSSQKESAIGNFLKREMEISELESILRSKFSLNEDRTMEFSPDLIQQRGDVIPPALVWIQGLIDSGRIKSVPGLEDCKNVYEVLSKFNSETYKSLLRESKKDSNSIQDKINSYEDSISEIAIPVTEMYLVIPESDLENYLRLLAIKGIKPKGIIVYDSSRVMIENFASKSRGDADEFSQILRNVVPERDGVIDYESQLLGLKITHDVRGGHAGQVIKESALGNRKVLKNKDNKFVIE
jgi:hypothetical protein